MADYSITTVLTAAASFDLTTLANVKADLAVVGNTEDAFILRAISKSSAAISQYCNRVFAQQTYQDLFRQPKGCAPYFSPDKTQPIMVRKAPLVSVTSITEDGTALVAGTDFELDLENGFIYRLDGNGGPASWPAATIVIVYIAGFVLTGTGATLPASIEDACIRMVKNARATRTRESDLKVEDIAGISRREYWISSGADGGNMTPDVEDILNNFRFNTIG